MIYAVIRKYKIRVGYETQCQQGVLRRGKFIDYPRTISFDESTIGIRRKISKSTVSKRRVAVHVIRLSWSNLWYSSDTFFEHGQRNWRATVSRQKSIPRSPSAIYEAFVQPGSAIRKLNRYGAIKRIKRE